MSTRSLKITAFIFLAVLCLTNVAPGYENSKKQAKKQQAIEIKVVPWGPTQADVAAARARSEQSGAVKTALRGVKSRFVGFEYIYNGVKDKSRASAPPTRFRAAFYDYTNDKTVFAEGDFAGRDVIAARSDNSTPGFVPEEFSAARTVIGNDARFAAQFRSGQLEIYEPMPPVTVVNGERLVNIGIRNSGTGENEIVGVSFKNDRVVRYENGAPPTSLATPESCGLTNALQGSTGEGVAGQAMLTVMQGGNPLWEMLIIRPSASSGFTGSQTEHPERSGLEIRDVRYKGKMVLKRGHVPILNVKYVSQCGPFRDWQYDEGWFNAPATGSQNPAPGIRVLADGQVATTIVENRNDVGDFQGVAVYRQNVGNGDETVLVTEMDASWYRYMMEWRFAPDGTIRPRFAFGSVSNSCVCTPRTHHVYWRFDFDVVNASNKIFQVERGRRFMTPIVTEAAIFRSSQLKRTFMIQNSAGDEAYQISPGLNDGAVTNSSGVLTDTFGIGDFWFTQFKGTSDLPGELDDPSAPTYPAANIAAWLNNETLVDQDVVVWYAAHQTRSDDASFTQNAVNVLSGVHTVGPDLRPIRW